MIPISPIAGTHELFLTRKRRKSEGFGRKKEPENHRPHQPLARGEQPEFREGASEQKRHFQSNSPTQLHTRPLGYQPNNLFLFR